MNAINQPLPLPAGVVLKNRLAKAAMTEGLADDGNQPTPALAHLYQRWAAGGTGLLITGNAMVDRRFVERSGNVVLDERTDMTALQAWTREGRAHGTHLWAQLSHPGRQSTRFHTRQPVAPSAVPLNVRGFFHAPRALETQEIDALIERFAVAATVARDGGFTGVQIHGAHGYLISQFLSPRSNRRDDRWGGNLTNRARFLLAVVEAVRQAVGPGFPVSVKLNAADFLHGGFTLEESTDVAGMLASRIDLLELSGGTYEQIAFITQQSARSRAREAYFLEQAASVRARLPNLPLMVTGGFRTSSHMHAALQSAELDVIGVGRPLCIQPDVHDLLQSTRETRLPAPEALPPSVRLPRGLGPHSPNATVRAVHAQATTAWFYRQIVRLAHGLDAETHMRQLPWVLATHLARDIARARRRKA